jgi:SAM-dependent methyltransferase
MAPQHNLTSTADPNVEERVNLLMRELGLDAAHFGTSVPMELAPLIAEQPSVFSSLSLLNTSRFPVTALSGIQDRLLVFSGDSGLCGEACQAVRPSIEAARFVEFPDYPAAIWTDMAAEHTDRIADEMLDFLARRDAERPATRLTDGHRQGTAGGIAYEVTGTGPALLLFPAMLSPSQWDPVIDRLSGSFAVVRLGGPHLGAVAVFENRGKDRSYRRVLRGMLQDARSSQSDLLLEVGCGSGVSSRWIAKEKFCASPIVASDLNPFLLKEAQSLCDAEGLTGRVKFEEANAEALPFADDSFDIVLAVTVIEECDADQAISEMTRVLKPGGRLALMVRACDINLFWNLPVDAHIREKAEAPIRQVAPAGCADASLAPRMRKAGLTDIVAYPTFHGNAALGAYYEPVIRSRFDADEDRAWQRAKEIAIADGTFTVMHPAHCAIGTKPI